MWLLAVADSRLRREDRNGSSSLEGSNRKQEAELRRKRNVMIIPSDTTNDVIFMVRVTVCADQKHGAEENTGHKSHEITQE